MEHLQLKASEVTHVSVALRLDSGATMGVIGTTEPAALEDSAISTTFTQDFINKLPL
jgi:hypothetical protein